MTTFVATSGPANWKLGKWSKMNATTWQEQKLDNPKIVYQFQVVGPSSSSSTVRLKMSDQNTEVLLLESTAIVFVNGSYFGEYGGEWQSGGGGKKTAYPPSVQAPAKSVGGPSSAPMNNAPVNERSGSNSKAMPPAASVSATKGAQPSETMQQTRLPAGRGAQGQAESITPVPQRAAMAPPPALGTSNIRKKAEGLDKSPDKIQNLINAAQKGDAATVKQLLESGVDPDGPAKDGRTPLMAAASSGSLQVIEALVGACADPTLGKGSETPLTIAFQKGNQNVLKALFSASFQTLDGMVGPGVVRDHRFSLSNIEQASSEAPASAFEDLREVTSKLAYMNRDSGATSPTAGKYGNYTDLMKNVDSNDADSDLMREEAVRLRMKDMVKTNKEIKSLDTSLH